jgi:A/G-specific adenine glycosylase
MPWKGEKDPYLIWLSEIILQQTRVEQGMPYFLAFKSQYPTIKHLADAPEDDVMRLWQGLGYYSRARNLHTTAKYIAYQLNGVFPATYNDIIKLKGVGSYTAAAIASFAFNEKQAVVDGNVIRILARVFGIDTPFDTTTGKKQFAELAQQLVDENEPAAYNQAIMDFGATVCVPANPKCNVCVFTKMCEAYQQGRIDELPVRAKKTAVKNRYFNFLVISNSSEIYLQKRTGNDIWKNLYQLPMFETDKPLTGNFKQEIAKVLGNTKFDITDYSKDYTQQLTHRKIHARFISIKPVKFSIQLENTFKVSLQQLNQYGFPKTVHLFLKEKGLL